LAEHKQKSKCFSFLSRGEARRRLTAQTKMKNVDDEVLDK